MTEYIDKTEAMRRFKPFGREIPKDQVMAVLARIEALNREPSEDGTLEVKVDDATKIGRVLISDDKHRGGLYYPDEDEPKGDDLISRAEAIDAIENINWYHQNQNKDMVHGANDDEHQAWYKADDVCKALEAVPSADRPIDEFDGMIFSTDKYMAFIDKKEIHILRKGACKVTVERMFNTEEDEE